MRLDQTGETKLVEFKVQAELVDVIDSRNFQDGIRDILPFCVKYKAWVWE